MQGQRGNILLIILAVAGILAASVGGYFWLASQKLKVEPVVETKLKSETVYTGVTQSTNWKFYSGQGISFKYPNNLVEQPYQVYGGGNIPEQHFINSQTKEVLWFRVQDNVNPPNGQKRWTSLDELCQYQDRNGKCLLKTISIDNQSALYSGNVVLFFNADKTKFYDFQFDGPNIAFNQTVFDQILSTFKFLNQK